MDTTKQFRTAAAVGMAAMAVVGLGASSARAAEKAPAQREAVTQATARVADTEVVAYGCPPGWVARPAGLVSALGPCVPASLVLALWGLAPPDGCPIGWVSPPPGSGIGPCVPGSVMIGSSGPTG